MYIHTSHDMGYILIAKDSTHVGYLEYEPDSGLCAGNRQ